MIRFQFFPRSQGINPEMKKIIACFEKVNSKITSKKHQHNSNIVLENLRPLLEDINYKVETGKNKTGKIHVPVLFGQNNQIDKSFNADAVSEDGRIVIEVEAG